MPQQKQVILFNNSGLDSDTAKRFKVPGNSDFILNDIVSFIDGEAGARVNVKGNESVYTSAAGTSFIGKVNDIENSGIIVFIANASGNDAIVRLNLNDNSITQILNYECNFSTDHPIIHANVIGDLLYWTDGFNPPRKINIQKGIDNIAGTGGYSAITDEVITAAKIPPLNPVIFTGVAFGYKNDSTIIFNNLRERQFQFAYRYLYDDKEKSLFSPLSSVLIPNGEEIAGGFFSTDQSLNNRIDFGLNTGSELVEKIEIAVKIGELGTWNSYQILDKSEESIPNNAVHTYQFRNDRSLIPLADSVVLQSNNFSPQIAGTQEFLPTNELAYGRIREGEDNIETDMVLSVNYLDYTYESTLVEFSAISQVQAFGDYDVTFVGLTIPGVTGGFIERSPYIIVFESIEGVVTSIEAPDDWDAFLADMTGGFRHKMHVELVTKLRDTNINDTAPVPFEWVTVISGADAVNFTVPGESSTSSFGPAGTDRIWFPMIFRNRDDGTVINNFNSVSGSVIRLGSDQSNKIRSFKTGLYNVGIRYSDAHGRKSAVQRMSDTSIQVLDHNNDAELLFNRPKTISYSIRHLPPSWAVSYQMVVSRNQSEINSVQWTIDSVRQETRLGISYALVGINQGILGLKEFVPKTVVEPYVFNEGDQLRRIGSRGSSVDDWSRIADGKYYDVLGVEFDTPESRKEYAYDQEDNSFKSEDVDLTDPSGEVVYNDNSQKILIQVDSDRDLGGVDIEEAFDIGSVIEVITPSKEQSEDLFFDIGQSYSIIGAGTVNARHQGQTQDQSASSPIATPATGVLDEGDYVWRIRYNIFRGVDFPVITKGVSDLYTSRAISYGKIGVENGESERNTFNLIRHSGKYFDNTNINDLSEFKFDDYVNIDDRFGIITRMIQVGDALKVYQPLKPTSIYIGKSFIKQGDGTDQVMTVDRTFGVVNPSLLDYGCQFPESVLRNERHVYFFDIYAGAFLRDSPNGIEPVSENLMDGYFKAKSKALLASGIDNVRVLTGYDDENGLVFLSFIDSVTPANNETLAFHEKSNRWTSFFSFIPDMYARFGNSIFTAKNNQLYIHNSDNVSRCEFYGTKYSRKFKVYSNLDPTMVKAFFSMSIHTNRNGWSAPEITIEVTDTYSRGMQSRLKNGKFVYEEGVAYAAFMRNMLTKGSTLDVTQLVQGDQLRGEVMSILLEESSNAETVLYEVDVKFSN